MIWLIVVDGRLNNVGEIVRKFCRLIGHYTSTETGKNADIVHAHFIFFHNCKDFCNCFIYWQRFSQQFFLKTIIIVCTCRADITGNVVTDVSSSCIIEHSTGVNMLPLTQPMPLTPPTPPTPPTPLMLMVICYSSRALLL